MMQAPSLSPVEQANQGKTTTTTTTTTTSLAYQKAQQLLQLADAVEHATENKRQQLEQIQRRSCLPFSIDTDDDHHDPAGDDTHSNPQQQQQHLAQSQTSSLDKDDDHDDAAVPCPSESQGHLKLDSSLVAATIKTQQSHQEQYLTRDRTLSSSRSLTLPSKPCLSANNSTSSSSSTTTSSSSKRKLIRELREQLQSSHQALVTMQENAALKLQKVQMEKHQLQTALEATQTKANQSQQTIEGLTLQLESLQRKLMSALGGDHVEWLIELETNQCKLLGDVDQLIAEKKEVVKERDELSRIVQTCATCPTKLSSYRVPETPQPEPQPQPEPKQQSFWSLLQLGEELDNMTTPVVPPKQARGLNHDHDEVEDETPFRHFSSQQQSKRRQPQKPGARSSFLDVFTRRLSTESAVTASPTRRRPSVPPLCPTSH